MGTRIRYFKNGDGLQQSKKTFQHPTVGARYIVLLNPDELTYKIVESLSETVVGEGTATNFSTVKIKAKKKLEDLGILFENEERAVKQAS